MDKPVVSVIVPCYNQAQYLPETLQSVLEQKFQDWECIVVNDGSPDNTEEVAQIWCKKDSRIKYLKKENGGLAETRNYGIMHAEGEFILPLDSDDKISPEYMEEAVCTFREQPDTKVIYSNRILFGARNEKQTPPPFRFEDMLTENRIPPAGFFRKTDFLKTQGYNKNMATQGLEDWDFWLSIIQPADKVIKLDGYHFLYRIKDVSMLTSITKEQNERLLLEIFRNHLPLYLEYFNPIRDHIEATYYKREAGLYKNSIEYKIGDFFLSPVKYIRKVFRRIFSGEKTNAN
ncbi:MULTISPECIES: glycosyltransferase family A protein [unclassified Dysgonomonas]|jgi:glycosyltransferase involved in cell wall biosynthesis|uniref:glycosyltransferase family 2 protein n=1 Tax=unclassified Dysgonomonas TaxID=2630389 RepID=UPI0025BDEFE2|nr:MULTISPECIES: glycosyltransferase family A protein [unclassified Dysgonomonas]MDR2005579.1 glycosyltransferase family 2 protein [Prevotella sp.]HMM02874.1 glycosyltransferase family A protein [Dysgonomonas sp.]